MSKQSTFDYKILASYLLPKGILEFFDVTAVNEDHTGIIEETGDERILLHIYLDEKKIHEKKSGTTLSPMVFTESRQVNDFPIRDHKVVLHVRRRRWLTAEGRNVILDRYSLLADNTSYSKEFADALKKSLDTYPITARSLGLYFKVDGNNPGACLQGSSEWFP
ncbi:MAG: hypothetical protein L6V92_10665 [Phocaeicola vulgatus]|nr:MAG: hypothetical protein L6V92_10665 [Phocaeicola vulgatus]